MQQELLLLSPKMQVSEAELRSMLADAYERGWRGFLEEADQCASEIVASFRSRNAPDPYCAVTTTTVSPSLDSNASEPYYFYSSMTIPQTHSGSREEIV